MKTTTRQIGNQDVARIKAALIEAGVRYAEQRDRDTTTLIFLTEDGQAAADSIAKELAR